MTALLGRPSSGHLPAHLHWYLYNPVTYVGQEGVSAPLLRSQLSESAPNLSQARSRVWSLEELAVVSLQAKPGRTSCLLALEQCDGKSPLSLGLAHVSLETRLSAGMFPDKCNGGRPALNGGSAATSHGLRS